MTTTPELAVDTFQGLSGAIRAEIAKVIVGQDEVVRLVLIGILANGHVLLEGVPGLGKTMLVRTLGSVLDLSFNRIQFTPDLMPADITGTEIMEEAGDGRRIFRFQRGPVFANIVLADEINRATPKTQSALLEAMQERTVTIAGVTHPLPQPFFVLATQNPIEQEGTYPLPEAQLDRFLYKINVPFPSPTELTQILERTTEGGEAGISRVATADELVVAQELVRQLPMASSVRDYVSRLIVATHPGESPSPMVNRYVRYGSSPRGGQALVLGAKAAALLDGRFNASFEDIATIAPGALRHRLVLNFEAQAAGISAEAIVADVLAYTPTASD